MNVSPQYVAEHFDDVAAAVKGGEVVNVSLPEKATLRLVLTSTFSPTPPQDSRVLGAGRADGDGSSVSFEQWQQIDREWKADLGERFGVI